MSKETADSVIVSPDQVPGSDPSAEAVDGSQSSEASHVGSSQQHEEKPLQETVQELLSDPSMRQILTDELLFKAFLITNNLALTNTADKLLYASALAVICDYASMSPENKELVGPSIEVFCNALAKHLSNNKAGESSRVLCYPDGSFSHGVCIDGIPFSFPITNQKLIKRLPKEYVSESVEKPVLNLSEPADSATLFSYLWDHRQGYGNQIRSGQPFDEMTAPLLLGYQNGNVPLREAMLPLRQILLQKSGQHRTRKEDSVYGRPVFTLFEGFFSLFQKEAYERALVPLIEEKYDQFFGFSLSKTQSYRLKYAIENVLEVLNPDLVHPNLGVRLDYFRTSDDDGYMLMLISDGQDGTLNIGIINLLSWQAVIIPPNGVLVQYSAGSNAPLRSAIHPALVLSTYFNYITGNVLFENNANVGSCVFLYDAGRSGLNHSPFNCPEPTQEELNQAYSEEWAELYSVDTPASPQSNSYYENLCRSTRLFVATEKKELADYLKFVSQSAVSEETLRTVQVFRKLMISDELDSLGRAQKFVLESVAELLKGHDQILVVVDAQGTSEQDALIQALSTELENLEGLTITKEVPDYLPSPEPPCRIVLVTCVASLSEPDYQRYEDLLAFADQSGFVRKYFPISTDASFADGGKGNYLLRIALGLINGYRPLWNPSQYKISLVDSPDDFPLEEGIANIVIDKQITAGPVSGALCDDRELLRSIQEQLQTGKKGVALYIEDPILRERAQKVFEFFNQSIAVLEPFERTGRESDESRGTLDKTIIRKRLEVFIENLIGPKAWSRLSEKSKTWLTSSLMTYEEVLENDPNMDFSGVVLMLSKAFELEMCRWLFSGYRKFLQNKYGDDLAKYPHCCLYDNSWDVGPVLFNPGQVSLGSIPYRMGLDTKGNLVDEQGYLDYLEYAKQSVFKNPEYAEENIRLICSIVNRIRATFRNNAAHKDPISAATARECIEYILSGEKALGRLLDLFLDSPATEANQMSVS